MVQCRANSCFVLGLISCSTAFVPTAPRGACRGPARTRPRADTTSLNLDPNGVDAFAAGGSEAASAVGISVVGSNVGGGLSSVWLAVGQTAPGDAYFATGLFGIAAAAVAVGTGYLVFSVISGENGLGSFLSKEKGQNPFYKDDFSQMAPKPPEFLNKIRLPEVKFVEIYNQPPAEEQLEDDESSSNSDSLLGGAQDANVLATAESLRQRLLEAVQAKDYALASTLERELASFMRKNGMSFDGDGK